MAWRVISTERGVWHVEAAVERRNNAQEWQLMLAFRSVDGKHEPDRFWAPYPLESESRSTLYAQAEGIDDDELRAVLARFVT